MKRKRYSGWKRQRNKRNQRPLQSFLCSSIYYDPLWAFALPVSDGNKARTAKWGNKNKLKRREVETKRKRSLKSIECISSDTQRTSTNYKSLKSLLIVRSHDSRIWKTYRQRRCSHINWATVDRFREGHCWARSPWKWGNSARHPVHLTPIALTNAAQQTIRKA